jgi:hypothetical protein
MGCFCGLIAWNMKDDVFVEHPPESIHSVEDVQLMMSNMDEKRQEMFLNGLNDDKQFQLLNTNYENFQHLVDKAIIIENKLMVMGRDDK